MTVEIKKEYHDNGKLKSETPYVNGVINGVKKTYHETGILESGIPYKDGKISGNPLVILLNKGSYEMKIIPMKENRDDS